MQKQKEKKKMRRIVPRNSTEAAVTCRPFVSDHAVRVSDGVLRNFSNHGTYIELSRRFKPGTILIVKMIGYPSLPSDLVDDERPPSIYLAEVKWQKELDGRDVVRYGMGLRYLE